MSKPFDGGVRSIALTVVVWAALMVLLALVTTAYAQDEYLPIAVNECVDLNSADIIELQLIIHIGPVRAEEILLLRVLRPFYKVEDISRVDGIGPSRLADILLQGLACVVVLDE